MIVDPGELTPVEFRGGRWLKRDDLFMPFPDVPLSGGKVRQALALLGRNRQRIVDEFGGVVLTATGVHSPQGLIIARVAQELELRCVVFVGATTVDGALSRHVMLQRAVDCGAELDASAKTAYETALVKAAQRWRREHDGAGYLVRFGINLEDDPEAILSTTADQVENVPESVERIVIAVGAGITAAGVMLGARRFLPAARVVCVQIAGYDRRETIYKITGFETGVDYDWHALDVPYARHVTSVVDGELGLDWIYEAKAYDWLVEQGLAGESVCFWIVGDSRHVREAPRPRRPKTPARHPEIVANGQPAITRVELEVPVDSLRVYPRNPRRGATSLIRDSLLQHGQYRPVVVNARTNEVLAGNHTFLAAQELGWQKIAATFVDVDDEEAARIVLVDNRTSDLAVYDDADLVALLESLEELDGTGYEQDDLGALLRSLENEEDEPEERVRYSFPVYPRELLIERAFEAMRASGFPYVALPLHVCMDEINALAALPDSKLVRTKLGYQVADTYHPHRYHARVGKQRNAIDVWNDDELLRVAIDNLLAFGMGWSGIVPVVRLTRGAQAVANFRPGFALSLLRRFAPEGARVLDTSAGYGGRLVGFLASSCSHYFGIDPARETQAANQRLAAELRPDGKTVALICAPAEDVDVEPLRDQYDVAVTSPPYFAKERYSDEETQSWKRYETPEEWREGFLVPMLRLQHAALRSGAINVINVADVKVGSRIVPLVEWTLASARDVGFEIVAVEEFPLTRRWGPQDEEVATEPVLVMRKDGR